MWRVRGRCWHPRRGSAARAHRKAYTEAWQRCVRDVGVGPDLGFRRSCLLDAWEASPVSFYLVASRGPSGHALGGLPGWRWDLVVLRPELPLRSAVARSMIDSQPGCVVAPVGLVVCGGTGSCLVLGLTPSVVLRSCFVVQRGCWLRTGGGVSRDVVPDIGGRFSGQKSCSSLVGFGRLVANDAFGVRFSLLKAPHRGSDTSPMSRYCLLVKPVSDGGTLALLLC